MEIKKFRLTEVGRFSSIEVKLAPTIEKSSNVTILVGNNGAGKTTLLKSLATSLSWFVNRLRSDKGNGSPIPEEVIRNSTAQASIAVSIDNECNTSSENDAESYDWTITKTRKGRKGSISSDLHGATTLAEYYKSLLTNSSDSSLPLVAFYPVERSVIEIPLKIKNRHTFDQIDGYDNSLSQGVDFRRFFEWFREREDTENESGLSQELLDKFSEIVKSDHALWGKLRELEASSRDRQLTAVRSAISEFMPGFKNLRIRRKPRLHMSIDKGDEQLNVAQLSQGEKSLMALVGDIARRLAMMNPELDNPLLGDGIVLIDEVDLHLHPKWQRTLVDRFTTTFPNCQFVFTTHSPLVISDNKDVLCYMLDDGELHQLEELFGMDANQVLLSVMGTEVRNQSVQQSLDELFDLIQDKELDSAKAKLSELESTVPVGLLDIAKAKLLIKRLEAINEKA